MAFGQENESMLTPTKVDQAGLTALIARLGKDCLPNQFVREFARNSIEAALRALQTKNSEENFTPTVIVEPAWHHFDETGCHKISFIDNGDGMTAEEMIHHLNNLSSSGHSNEFENYGVGAKIAAFTRNHEGILYESWKDGIGHCMLIGYDSSDRSYGIIRQNIQDEWLEAPQLPEDYPHKPDIIDEHGTRVTLYGSSPEEDTMMPPNGTSGGRDEWLRLYMNSRFFKLPNNLSLKVRVRYHTDRHHDKKHNANYPISGQSSTLDRYAESSGTVKLRDVKAHWWILKSDRESHGRLKLNGHTGVIHEDEIFEVGDGRSNRAVGFGISLGKENVVIYIEASRGYRQNVARTGLTDSDGNVLPWERWEDEFRGQLPNELKDYVAKQFNDLSNKSHGDSIEKRIREMQKLFKISRYRVSATGRNLADPDSITTSTSGASGSGGSGSNGTRSGRGSGPGASAMRVLSGLIANGGVPAEVANPSNIPTLHWVGKDDEAYTQDIEDRAANYNFQENRIFANADFQGFIDLRNYFASQFEDIEGAEAIIKDTVQEAYEQQLIEVVLGALSLKNRPKWSNDEWKQGLSDEALTLAVMCRYHQVTYINRILKNKLRQQADDNSKSEVQSVS